MKKTNVGAYIKHLERMRQDFVANVSHELRTPLTVIQGYLESLLNQPAQDKKLLKKIYQQMHEHSSRMATIIEKLLLLSRLESDDEPPFDETSQVDVAKLLKTLCVEAKNVSASKNHKITLKAQKGIFLLGSENELRSLFSNIIINAVKYTPAKGTILVEWHQDKEDQGVFKVTDSGIGIAKEHLPKITERFYRVDKARSRESGGTGLGLAIVKHVLLRHHGELTIESELHHGSAFACIFPCSQVVS